MGSEQEIAENIAQNLKQLREARALSQQQAAARAGIPRPTWANLESGSANPTVTILTKVADSLQVRLEELLGPPKAAARFFPADSLPLRQRAGVRVRKLLPEPVAGLEIARMSPPPGAQFSGVPHTPGTREYLTCEAGRVVLTASGSTYELAPGDVVVFRGDQRHGYRNPTRQVAVAYSVIAFAQAGG